MAHRSAHSPSHDRPAPPAAEEFNHLVGQSQDAAYNLAYRVLGDVRAAADVTQSAFLTLYRQRPPCSPAAFRRLVFRQIAAACLRRLSTQLRLLATLQPSARQPVEPPILGRDRSAQDAILTLPPQERIVLVLADVCGLGYQDIGQVTGLPLVTVNARLSRARAALTAYLRR